MDQRLQHPAEQYMLKAAEAILMAEAYYAGLDNKNLSDNIKIAFEMTTKYSKQQLKLLHWCDTDDAWLKHIVAAVRNSDNPDWYWVFFGQAPVLIPPKNDHISNYVPKIWSIPFEPIRKQMIQSYDNNRIPKPSPEAVKDLLRETVGPDWDKVCPKDQTILSTVGTKNLQNYPFNQRKSRINEAVHKAGLRLRPDSIYYDEEEDRRRLKELETSQDHLDEMYESEDDYVQMTDGSSDDETDVYYSSDDDRPIEFPKRKRQKTTAASLYSHVKKALLK